MAKIKLQDLKIAIVYDHLNTDYGGAELVLKNLLTIFPQADFFTSIYNQQKVRWIKQTIITTWLNHLAIFKNHHRLAGLLMPMAFESLDFSAYQLIISVSGGAAKGIITKPHQLHLCYLLTPTRYLFSHQPAYWQQPILQLPLLKQLSQLAKSYLSWWDKIAAYRPDELIAISQEVAKRSKQFYHRPIKQIIYPPVKLASTVINPLGNFYLIIARLVTYKQIDLAIQAALKFNKKLLIIGDGPQKQFLIKLAKNSPNIKFLGQLNSKQKNHYLATCKALILPGIEDFGISALEANSFAKPVILDHRSGAAEILHHKIHAIHLAEQTLASYQQAFSDLETTLWDQNKLQANAQLYQEKNFQTQFRQTVLNFYQQ